MQKFFVYVFNFLFFARKAKLQVLKLDSNSSLLSECGH